MESPESAGPLPVALYTQREDTIAALCEHFSRDRLSLEEFERRLDAVHRVQTGAELTALLADLPPLAARGSPQAAAATAAPRISRHARSRQHFIAIMSGLERRGGWRPARRTFCYAFMGGAQLDFREAVLPPGETEVFAIAIMGGAEIIVPPGLRVDCEGVAIMGGFDHVDEIGSPDNNAPRLRITGFALMGGVEVVVRKPGESAKDAQRRLQAERRRLKQG